MKKTVLLGFMLILSVGAFSEDINEFDVALESIILKYRRPDVRMDSPTLSNYIGSYMDQFGSEALFLSKLRGRALEIVRDPSLSEDLNKQMKLRLAVSLLGRFDITNSANIFASCLTNIVCEDCLSDSAMYLTDAIGVASAGSMILNLTGHGSDRFDRAVISGYWQAVGFQRLTEAQTNCLYNFCAEIQLRNVLMASCDGRLAQLSPQYATSSNRLAVINRAIALGNPEDNTNYLYRVKAELEALPPGMLH